ncbi:MAG: DUF4013 domain-containing protein [Methanospirillum sp.]|nr:DUF4013 domain-containing protein [Methanospirillum sp.]
MDFGKAITESAIFTRDTVWGNWKRWILLIVSLVIFPLIFGYLMEIFRGNPVPPECTNWIARFIDGLKYLVAAIIYSIPVVVILIITFIPVLMELISQVTSEDVELSMSAFVPYILPVIGGVAIACIVSIIIALLSTIGFIRMARMNRFLEAFNFSAILTTIRKIGWGTYILGFIIISVISFILGMVVDFVAELHLIGILLALIVWPLSFLILPPGETA